MNNLISGNKQNPNTNNSQVHDHLWKNQRSLTLSRIGYLRVSDISLSYNSCTTSTTKVVHIYHERSAHGEGVRGDFSYLDT